MSGGGLKTGANLCYFSVAVGFDFLLKFRDELKLAEALSWRKFCSSPAKIVGCRVRRGRVTVSDQSTAQSASPRPDGFRAV